MRLAASLCFACLSWACTSERPPLVVSANQDPVVALEAPPEAPALEDVAVSVAGSFDVDGEIAAVRLELGDGTVVESSTATHRYESEGMYTIKATVTDDGGATATGELRIVVGPPLDGAPPVVDSLVVSRGALELDDGDVVAGGRLLFVVVEASDAEASEVALALSAVGPSGEIALDLVEETLGEGSARVVASLLVPDVDGDVVVRARASDGHNEAERSFTFAAIPAGTDEDGDGLVDDDDPDPEVFHGARVQLFALEGIPRDLLRRDKAEDLVEDVRAAAPVFEAVTADDVCAWSSSTSGPGGAPGLEPEASALGGDAWALLYAGWVAPFDEVDEVELAISAEGVGVVLLDGAPLASADEEYALNFFRTERLPASARRSLYADAFLEVLVASDGEQPSWSLAVRFYSGGTLVQEGLLPGDLVAPGEGG